MLYSALRKRSNYFVVLTKSFTLIHTQYTHAVYAQYSIICVYKHTYSYAHALEAAEVTVTCQTSLKKAADTFKLGYCLRHASTVRRNVNRQV